MTFNNLFIKKDLGKNIVNLILNEDCENEEYYDDQFEYEMKVEYADKFINYLSEKYSSVDEFFKYYENSRLYLHESLYSEFGAFAKSFLRIEMTLLDYSKKYKFDIRKTDNHEYYAIDLALIVKNSFHGSIYVDDCTEIDVIEKDGEKWARLTAYKNDLRFNLNDEYLLSKVKVYFVEMK